jgi:hypothetical protein
MAIVTGILCQMITGDIANAGTDGRVYLGLGAREFRMDSSADDYERGSWREYIMGLGPVEPNLPAPQIRVRNRQENDPRVGLPIDTAHLAQSPVYIRFEPAGSSPNWNLKFAAALVYAPQFVVAYLPPPAFDNLWLGDPYGKILYLTQIIREGGEGVAEVGRRLAAQLKASA